MLTLAQFIFRLSFGMSLAMVCTPARLVSSGYYRNNLYVLLGLNVLASLTAWMGLSQTPLALWPPLAAAILSYLGAVFWLYEARRPGKIALAAIAAVTLCGAWLAGVASESPSSAARLLWRLDPVAGGLVLGVTMAAMLLGHWYLNAPSMSLKPLQQLVLAMAVAIALRGAVCAAGLAWEYNSEGPFGLERWLFLSLRWLSGIIGAAAVAALTWQTLKIPNTQSATGMLYVGVIVTFVGELTSQLLSAESLFPL
jgi:hypothetical protein